MDVILHSTVVMIGSCGMSKSLRNLFLEHVEFPSIVHTLKEIAAKQMI